MLRASHTTGVVGSLGGRGSVRASSWSRSRCPTEPRPPESIDPSRGRVRRSKGSAARYASVPDRMRARGEARPPRETLRGPSECLRKGEVAAERRLPHPRLDREAPRPPENPGLPHPGSKWEADDDLDSASEGPTHPPRPPVRSSRRFPGPAGGGTPDRGPWGRRRATPGRSSGSARDRPCRHSGDATGLGSDILYAIAARTLQPGLSFDRRWILDYPLG